MYLAFHNNEYLCIYLDFIFIYLIVCVLLLRYYVVLTSKHCYRSTLN